MVAIQIDDWVNEKILSSPCVANMLRQVEGGAAIAVLISRRVIDAVDAGVSLPVRARTNSTSDFRGGGDVPTTDSSSSAISCP